MNCLAENLQSLIILIFEFEDIFGHEGVGTVLLVFDSIELVPVVILTVDVKTLLFCLSLGWLLLEPLDEILQLKEACEFNLEAVDFKDNGI